MEKKKKFKALSKKQIMLTYAVVILVFLSLSQLIISAVEHKQNEKIKDICLDTMIQYRSCEDLSFVKKYCAEAEEQYELNNCSLTNKKESWLWEKK